MTALAVEHAGPGAEALAAAAAKDASHWLASLRAHLSNRRLYPAGKAWAAYGRRYERADARRCIARLRALCPRRNR